ALRSRRKPEGKDGTRVWFARRVKVAAVSVHDSLRDGEAETGAALRRGAGRVRAVEAFEDVRQMFGGDARAVVGHGENHGTVSVARGNADCAAFLVVVNRVGEQVRDDEREPVAVARAFRRSEAGLNGDVAFGSKRAHQFHAIGGRV